MRSARLAGAVLGVALLGACSSQRSTSRGSNVSASASATSAMREATIPIEGMSCGSCVARVRRRLKSMDGVVDVEVNIEHRNALVRFDAAKTSPASVVAAIDDLGYAAGAPTVTPATGGR